MEGARQSPGVRLSSAAWLNALEAELSICRLEPSGDAHRPSRRSQPIKSSARVIGARIDDVNRLGNRLRWNIRQRQPRTRRQRIAIFDPIGRAGHGDEAEVDALRNSVRELDRVNAQGRK